MYSKSYTISAKTARRLRQIGNMSGKAAFFLLLTFLLSGELRGQIPGVANSQPGAAAPEGLARSLPIQQRNTVQATLASQKMTAEELDPAIFVDQRDAVMIPVAGESKKRSGSIAEPVAPYNGQKDDEKTPLLISSILSDLTAPKQSAPVKTAAAPQKRETSDASRQNGASSFFNTILKQKESSAKVERTTGSRRVFMKRRPLAELLRDETEQAPTAVVAKKPTPKTPPAKTVPSKTETANAEAAKKDAPKAEAPASEPIATPFAEKSAKTLEVQEGEDLILGEAEKMDAKPLKQLKSKSEQKPEPLTAQKAESPEEDESLASEIKDLNALPSNDELSAAETNEHAVRIATPVIEINTAGPKRLMVGQEAEYSIRVRNASGAAAKELVVRTEIPAGVEISGIQPTTGTSRIVENAESAGQMLCVWKLGDLPSEKEENLLLKFVPRVRSNIDFVSNYDFEKSAIKSGIEVQEPILELLIEGRDTIDWGVEDKYRMQIRNTGNGEAENIRLTVATGENDSATRVLKVLRPGEEKTMEINIKTVLDEKITVKVDAAADYGFTASAVKEIEILRGQLDVFVEAPEMQFVNDTVDYLVHVSNVGRAILQDVEVAAAIPASVEYITCSGEGTLDDKTGRLLWKIPMIKPQEEFVYQVTGRMTRSGESRFDVTAADKTGVLSNGEALIQIEAIAALEMKINKPSGPVAIGTEIEYEIVITNNGTKAAEEIDAGFFLPAGLKPLSVDGGGAVMAEESKVLFSKINFLGPGQSVAYKVHAEAVAGGNHKVQAVLESRPDDIQLVSEEMSYFYQKRTVAKRGGNGAARVALKQNTPVPAAQPAISPNTDQPALLPLAPMNETSASRPITAPTTPATPDAPATPTAPAAPAAPAVEMPLPELPLTLPGPNKAE